MGAFLAHRLVRFLSARGVSLKDAHIAILGLTFKENVSDTRNSRVPDIINELKTFGVSVTIADPRARPEDAVEEYGIALAGLSGLKNLDAMVLAVPHREFIGDKAALFAKLKHGGILIDVKSAFEPAEVPSHLTYWSL